MIPHLEAVHTVSMCVFVSRSFSCTVTVQHFNAHDLATSLPSHSITAKAELKSRQPGNDGGVKKDRHKGGKFNKEGLLRATPAVRDRVVEICIMHLADKEEGKSHSEADYERAMRTTRRVLRRSRDREEHKVAYLLPWTFKGALSLLENSDQARGFLGEGG